MTDGEAASAPLADFAFHHDFVVEAAWRDEARPYLYYGHTDDTVFPPHGRRSQAGALEEPAGAAVENEQIVRIKNDTGGVALTPFDAQSASIYQQGVIEILSRGDDLSLKTILAKSGLRVSSFGASLRTILVFAQKKSSTGYDRRKAGRTRRADLHRWS